MEVSRVLEYAAGACSDARWEVKVGLIGDALWDIGEARRFLEEAENMIKEMCDVEVSA